MQPVNFANILIVAMAGATATVGLRSGDLRPFSRTITRDATPRKYWIGIGVCALIVLLSIASTIVQLRFLRR
jgi:hypothetical protein